MTHIWISPQLAHTLGWALLHFLWQGLALAALCSAFMAMCRTASVRYLIALATLILMLAAPLMTFFVLRHSATTVASTTKFASTSSAAAPDLPSASVSAAVLPAAPNSPAPLRSDGLLWLVEVWFAGVFFFSLRTAGGLIVIERMRRNRARPVSALLLEKCLALQRRMGLARVIRYCECLCLEAPAVIGWFRPVVLLPVAALSGLSEDQLAAVISHELAHVRRLDSFVNLFQIAAETLLFYHPAVWWLSKRIRAERENCCDDDALAVCGDAIEYARALTLMEEWRQAPAMAMAANRSPLVERVARLLGIGSARSGVRSAGIAASVVCLVGAILAANGLMAAGHSSAPASVGDIDQSSIRLRSFPASDSLALSAPRTRTQVIQVTFARRFATVQQAQHLISTVSAHSAQEQGQGQGAGQSHSQSQGEGQSSSSSYIDQMKTQGYENLTADELISLKVQGVTPEYIQEVKALGLHPTINELISMRVQGINPQYIKDMRAIGFNAGINELIGMRVQGVTPEYVRDMRAAGIDGTANDFIGMRVQGLTPEYVKEMKAAGVEATPGQLIGMKVQDFTPDYIKEMKAVGVDGDLNQMIGMRVQGLTPEYVKEMKAEGIDASANQLIGMKVQGLTPEYVREMKAVGITADASQLIGMKVQGVTAEYIKEMKAAGVDTSANQWIGMKVQGLTPEYVREMKAVGITADASQLIGMKVQGVTPEYVKDMKAADINADAHQLIGMRVQGLTPEYIKDMKAAGINADAHQLISMRVQGVTPEYVKSLQSAGLQNLTANDYIRARVAGVTPEFIANVRSHGFKDLSIEKLIELKEANIF